MPNAPGRQPAVVRPRIVHANEILRIDYWSFLSTLPPLFPLLVPISETGRAQVEMIYGKSL